MSQDEIGIGDFVYAELVECNPTAAELAVRLPEEVVPMQDAKEPEKQG